MDMLASAKTKKYPTSMETYVGTDKKVTVKTAAEIEAMLKERLGDALTASEIREYKTGVCQLPAPHLLVTVTREKFLDLVDALGELDFPHFHVMSGNDDGETIRQISHFSLFRREGRGKEVTVTVTVHIPKDDLVIPSLHSRIPGIDYSEREMFEMLGIDHDGQPNKELVFLPDGWDRSILPWRRDEKGPNGKNAPDGTPLVRELN
ncbi:MAG: NADH-quinone oxidoreductase subunit C [Pyramidobacter sp.]|jgi:membrane-bound hydrogenase subunit beta|nr:NADH-quinone oxidoreductase subunit C [Pyramidobacter sp.]MBP3752294.1 NADH-quinone oxidoreductase subunit C [Pyramidobacter sp.]MBP3835680.1 NADH-quinone oxidoreductase subunit C [Pyramidobacter sp.]MBP3848193.1 NADH-quinone oxidoreductase subunit C [Pyramidobacter sp.]MBQ4491248.1 NADH-quinone oxidoreductase subunit C [Pyramidobacter sp.]